MSTFNGHTLQLAVKGDVSRTDDLFSRLKVLNQAVTIYANRVRCALYRFRTYQHGRPMTKVEGQKGGAGAFEAVLEGRCTAHITPRPLLDEVLHRFLVDLASRGVPWRLRGRDSQLRYLRLCKLMPVHHTNTTLQIEDFALTISGILIIRKSDDRKKMRMHVEILQSLSMLKCSARTAASRPTSMSSTRIEFIVLHVRREQPDVDTDALDLTLTAVWQLPPLLE
ncbi:uncharacterized protein BJ212DRAFT_1303015 [Suillus subaureus]|uniref:Uncharacterized protein n=1 Tax=Suillus subaureus TaxID=48587 RepID=A0A9P7E177_9AGAM|nr:uncharacterized protein BJ212DRAFT_1303015 [Suillus subaureus]KAG1808399.1 hypothetical protein BJ212DRAFT_1303015 [Suillus subaureus]